MSQGRKRIGFLIGAGAPLSIKVNGTGNLDTDGQALIPGVEELTTLVLAGLKNEKLRAVGQEIKAKLGPRANIETILSQVRLLENALGNNVVNGLDSAGYSTLGAELCNQIGKIVGAKLPPERNAYNELVAWVNGTQRTNAIEIFTTNYDLLFEEAFESVRAPYFDGFTGGNMPFFDPVTVAGDDLPARWSRLWKLHGSLGWGLEEGSVVRRGGRETTQLIYPDHLKYNLTQKQPYSALFERLKRFLLTPDTLLLTAGFSFRDAHICAVLDETLAMNANAAVFAFQFCELEEEIAAKKMAFDRPNLSVYAADGAVINGVEGKWRLGDMPKNWEEIRASFWGPQGADAKPAFLLGDFSAFARFCALAQASELQKTQDARATETTLITEGTSE